MAGGAHADADDVLADRRQAELRIEAGDAEDAAERHVQLFGDALQGAARQPSVGLLGGVQRLDQPVAFAQPRDDDVEGLHVYLGLRGGSSSLLGGYVPGQHLVLRAVADVDAVDRAGALA